MDALRKEHDAVLEQISARKSIAHFAVCGLSAFLGFLGLTAGVVLLWKSRIDHNEDAWIAFTLGGLASAFALVRWVLGMKERVREHALNARLAALRHALGYDEPGSFLPTK